MMKSTLICINICKTMYWISREFYFNVESVNMYFHTCLRNEFTTKSTRHFAVNSTLMSIQRDCPSSLECTFITLVYYFTLYTFLTAHVFLEQWFLACYETTQITNMFGSILLEVSVVFVDVLTFRMSGLGVSKNPIIFVFHEFKAGMI